MREICRTFKGKGTALKHGDIVDKDTYTGSMGFRVNNSDSAINVNWK